MDLSSLPPIIGVMGNNKMQQTYKYQHLEKKITMKRKKKAKALESKHGHGNLSNFGGTAANKAYSGGSIPQAAIQNKSSNHFNFSSQQKNSALVNQHHGGALGRQHTHAHIRCKKRSG